MPQTDVYDRTGATVGSVELSDELFAAPVNAAVLHQVVTAQLAGRRTGHQRHQDPRRGPRRRQEAVPPEGHRPRPPGLDQRPALPRRRRRLRPAPALVRAAPAAQDEAPGAAWRADRQVRRRGDQVVDTFGLEAIRTKDLVGVLARARGHRPGPRRRPRPRREARAVGPQPADASRSSWPTRSTWSTCSTPTSSLIEQPSLARMQEVYA